MLIARMMTIAVLLTQISCASRPLGTDTEFLIAVDRADFSLQVAGLEYLTEEAQQKVRQFQDAVEGLPTRGSPWWSCVQVSRDGRTVICEETIDERKPSEPTRIWIWRDWTDPESLVTIHDHREAYLISDHHVMLRERTSGSVSILDVRTPSQRFEWQRSGKGRVIHKLANDGSWARLEEDGSVYLGRLGQDDLGSGGTRLDVESAIRNMVWLRDGRFAVLETDDGRLVAVTAEGSVLPGHAMGEICPWHLGIISELLVGDDGVIVARRQRSGLFGSERVRCFLLTVDADGMLEERPMSLGRSETPVLPSPNGKYVGCSIVTLSLFPPGGVGGRLVMRRTPNTSRVDPLPAGLDERAWPIGWLSASDDGG
jgi:hypothetical protein